MADGAKFIWNELATPDPEASKAFYATVVGWSAADAPMPESPGSVYTLFKNGDTDVGGMIRMEGPQWQGIPPHWLAYIGVDDVDATVAKVEPAGGKVLHPPTDIPGVGRFCVIADPLGAAVALMTMTPAG